MMDGLKVKFAFAFLSILVGTPRLAKKLIFIS